MQFSGNAPNPARSFSEFFGDHKVVVLPDPIPNSAVKHHIADGSAGIARVRVGSRQIKKPQHLLGFFLIQERDGTTKPQRTSRAKPFKYSVSGIERMTGWSKD